MREAEESDDFMDAEAPFFAAYGPTRVANVRAPTILSHQDADSATAEAPAVIACRRRARPEREGP